MYLGFMINYNQGPSTSTGFGVASDADVAVGVSGSALFTLSVISTTLCCLAGIFSFRKLSGDMVSGGTNSLVLSAACHVSIDTRLGKPRGVAANPRPESRSENEATHQYNHGQTSSNLRHRRQPSISSTDVSLEQLRVVSDSRTDTPTQPSTVSLCHEEAAADEERLLPDMTPEEVRSMSCPC